MQAYKKSLRAYSPQCSIHLCVYTSVNLKCVGHWHTHTDLHKKLLLLSNCICSPGQTMCSANKWLECNVPWPSICLSAAPYIYCCLSSYITRANGALHPAPSCPLLKRLRGHLCLLYSTDSPSSFLTKHEGRGNKACEGEMLQWIIMFHNMPHPPSFIRIKQ